MTTAEIKNWKEVQEQFGLEMAKKISKELNLSFLRSPEHVAVPCSKNSEAIALFEFLYMIGDKHYYEYTGTAN